MFKQFKNTMDKENVNPNCMSSSRVPDEDGHKLSKPKGNLVRAANFNHKAHKALKDAKMVNSNFAKLQEMNITDGKTSKKRGGVRTRGERRKDANLKKQLRDLLVDNSKVGEEIIDNQEKGIDKNDLINSFKNESSDDESFEDQELTPIKHQTELSNDQLIKAMLKIKDPTELSAILKSIFDTLDSQSQLMLLNHLKALPVSLVNQKNESLENILKETLEKEKSLLEKNKELTDQYELIVERNLELADRLKRFN